MRYRAAALIVEDGRILLLHRTKDDRDYWVLPGGSVESGESPEQACCREVKEETGLSIRIVERVLTFSSGGREEAYFLAKRTGGELQLGEPERSRQSPSNQYVLEWIATPTFDRINFQPEHLKAIVAEHLAAAMT